MGRLSGHSQFQVIPLEAKLPAFMVVLAGISAALHVGKLAPAIPVLQSDMGISLLAAGFLLSLVQLAGMCLGLVIGSAAEHWGLRRTILMGLGILSVSSFAGAWASQGRDLLILRGLEGVGFLMVATSGPSLIRAQVASAHLSKMLGLWGTYMPFGMGLAMLTGALFLQNASWHNWWMLMSSQSLAVMFAVLVLVPATPAQPGPIRSGEHGHKTKGAWIAGLRLTLCSVEPWLVAMSFGVYSSQWLAVIGFLPSIYSRSVLPSEQTALLTALAAGVNMIGNAASGWMLFRGWKASALLSMGYACMGISAYVVFSDAPFGNALVVSPMGKYLAVLLFSAVGGLIPGTLFTLAVKHAPEEKLVATVIGWVQQLSAMGQFAGPPLVAWVATQTGNWSSTWWVTGICSVMGLVFAHLLKNRPVATMNR